MCNAREGSRTLRLTRLVSEHAEVGCTVAVMGLSYKPGTNVIEQSQGILVASALSKMGYRIIVHDPMATDAARAVLGSTVNYAGSPEEALEAAEVIILLIPWPQYRSLPVDSAVARSSRVIIDCWRLVDRDALQPGIRVIQLGLNAPIPVLPDAGAAVNLLALERG